MVWVYLGTLLFIAILLVGRRRARHLNLTDQDQILDPLLGPAMIRWGIVLYGFGLLIPLWDYWYLPPVLPRSWTTSLLGLLLFVAGSWVRYAAYRALGPFFTFRLAIREGHCLVTTGVYRYIRHPGYAGTILVAVGQPLILGSLVGLLLLSLPIVLFVCSRIPLEEQILLNHFEDKYRSYLRRSWRLCPYLF